jgi:predicted RNA binding protein YcfA (HicA-like mRNA interferase family)
MGARETLEAARRGARNLRFRDVAAMLEALGFRLVRVSGSHHIFAAPNVRELINLQEVKGQCKPYQLRQILRLVERYNLDTEAGS